MFAAILLQILDFVSQLKTKQNKTKPWSVLSLVVLISYAMKMKIWEEEILKPDFFFFFGLLSF